MALKEQKTGKPTRKATAGMLAGFATTALLALLTGVLPAETAEQIVTSLEPALMAGAYALIGVVGTFVGSYFARSEEGED